MNANLIAEAASADGTGANVQGRAKGTRPQWVDAKRKDQMRQLPQTGPNYSIGPPFRSLPNIIIFTLSLHHINFRTHA
jgi:hypothetical protein